METACPFSETFLRSRSAFGLSGPEVHEFRSNILLEHHHQFLSCQRREAVTAPHLATRKSNNVLGPPHQNSWL
jgi:hypothetical protein